MTPIALTLTRKKRRRNLDLTPTLPIPTASLPARLRPKHHPRSVRPRMSQRLPPRSPRLRRLLRITEARTCSLVT